MHSLTSWNKIPARHLTLELVGVGRSRPKGLPATWLWLIWAASSLRLGPKPPCLAGQTFARNRNPALVALPGGARNRTEARQRLLGGAGELSPILPSSFPARD
jgi:hypothetical protein